MMRSYSGALPAPPRHLTRMSLWLSLLIIAACGWLYLGQSGRVSAANAQLQMQQQQTQRLEQRRSQALAELGRVSSPAYILARAADLGMVPGDWGDTRGTGQP